MNKLLLLIISLLTFSATSHADEIAITPKPASVIRQEGKPFVISAKTTLFVDAPLADSIRISDYASSQWPGMKTAGRLRRNQIRFTINESLGNEAYTINVAKDNISIQAATGAGLFYGLQTLIQLDDNGTVPAIRVEDAPRFEYRGLLFDVSRHFRDKEFIKKQLDAMARLKLNTMHFHLTDAAGWRMQIDRYPLLTGMGAWRKGDTWKEWNAGGGKYLSETDSLAYGGYYTKDDMREIISYAADRYITIIPEIEIPSHSEEVTTAYPMLGCTKSPYTTSDMCPGSETTFEFLQNVLDEVIDLFPSHYIHIGGDEAPKTHWHTCPDCMTRIKDENLKDVDGLQSYMIHRIERYLNSKGRSIIGWDEIMQGGLSPTATVQAWRGTEAGIAAATQGNGVIMSPGKYCYLDSYQDAPHTQPEAIGGYLPLEVVYSYDPAPATLPDSISRHIKGLEGTLFAEYIPTDGHYEYMLYPRAIGIAEVAWTPQEQRDFDDFRRRAVKMTDGMRERGYSTFDLANECGNRIESKSPVRHLASGKPVKYNLKWWRNYPASEATTLTDGLRGGWNYNDQRWQGFLASGRNRMDVTVDMESEKTIRYIGAEFMQVCGPGVLMPEQVIISISNDGENFTTLSTIDHKVIRDDKVTFKTFSWEGRTNARYIRYQAFATEGVLFSDEIVVR